MIRATDRVKSDRLLVSHQESIYVKNFVPGLACLAASIEIDNL